MKEHPNIQIIQSFFNHYNNQDAEGIRQVMDENIVWHIPGEHPLSGVKKGIDEVTQYFDSLSKAAFQAAPIVMGVNEGYVIDCHRNWSNLKNGDNLNNMSCLLWVFKDQKIVEVYNFPESQNEVNRFFRRVYG